MSSRKRKAPGSAGRHPRTDPNPRTDATKNPGAITPAEIEVIDVSSEDITSSGSEGQEARKEMQNLFEKFKEPIKNLLQGNRERFTEIIMESFDNLQPKFEDVLKIQCEQRKEIYQKYSHQFLTLVVMWNIDVDQVKKHAEKLSNILDEQQKLCQEFQVIHKQKIEEFKALCNQHLKNLQDIKSYGRRAIVEEARQKMDAMERKLTTETMQEEKTGMQSSLLSLLFS